MHDQAKRERFVELRAEGRSYADCASELQVSKPTLLKWGRDLAIEVTNARTLRLDTLCEQYVVSKARRIEAFGERLQRILCELDKRDLSDVPTVALCRLALDYGSALKAEAEPLVLEGGPNDTAEVFELLPRARWTL